MPSSLPPKGEIERGSDSNWTPGARLGIWFQPPRRIILGNSARIRWWHRIRAIALLIFFVIFGGTLLATLTGLIIFAGGFLIEQAIG
tara:strand:- start:790 stop:1050 length:261 start_codon:yes stop_codon:yes gene_type:complete